VARRLAAAGVEAVALAMVDPAGVTRVKCIPIRRFEEVARFGVGLSNVFSVFLVNDGITSSPGIEGPTGDTRLVPDPASAVALAASPGWALAAVDQRDQEGEPWPPCGRTFARRMLERLSAHGLELRGAYELEFFLGNRVAPREADEPEPIPAHVGPGYSAPVLADQEPFATDGHETATIAGSDPRIPAAKASASRVIPAGPSPPANRLRPRRSHRLRCR